ncbi:MAG: hypothetical protein K8J09_16515, partial [Planctomycetes bacterium]|nr:hypothetical protein [Planctomycetota bacterium]
TLLANGNATDPVVVTSLADDSAGGDTNGNGPSSGSPTAWRGIVFNPGSDASTLHWLDARFGGYGYVSNLHLNGASPTFVHCASRGCFTSGMNLNGAATPSVVACSFVGNGGYAIDNVPIAALPGFADNSAAGNTSGNFLRVTDGSLSTPLVVGSQSCLNGAIVFAANLHVLAGGDLTLQQGVVCKFQGAYEAVIDGALHARGTGYEPVVFTDLRDDEFGGDTNGDGPSGGQWLAWRGLTVPNTAAASSLEHVRLRFCGYGYVAALGNASPLLSLRSVRADRAYNHGIVLAAAAGTPTNLVAWGCGNYGIHLTGGSFAIAHATCNANHIGIRRENTWTGSVVNSISRGNNSADFDNFPAAQVFASNGAFAGQNGNLAVDPSFVDASNGDLHLSPTSPCLGAADLLTAFLSFADGDQNSRLLDHALLGLPLPDMGAFELGAWQMQVAGSTRLGTTLDYTITGPAGVSFYLFGVLDGLLPVVPYGFFLAGGSASLISPPIVTGTTFQLPVPPIPGLVGLQVGVQALTFPLNTTAVGNFTRLHQLLVRP